LNLCLESESGRDRTRALISRRFYIRSVRRRSCSGSIAIIDDDHAARERIAEPSTSRRYSKHREASGAAGCMAPRTLSYRKHREHYRSIHLLGVVPEGIEGCEEFWAAPRERLRCLEALRRTHRRQPETPNPWARGAVAVFGSGVIERSGRNLWMAARETEELSLLAPEEVLSIGPIRLMTLTCAGRFRPSREVCSPARSS
jgi:hypothetical protein